MKIIVGLGNIGTQYEKTRHNVGFEVAGVLARRWGVKIDKLKFEGFHAQARIAGEDVILVKPATYMNLSGRCVAAYARYYRLDISDILIVYDDMDLALGAVRVRAAGSAGTHNGMKSVVSSLDTADIPRIRVGIGEKRRDAVDFVLSRFSPQEAITMETAFEKAADAAETFLKSGIDEAMNRHNYTPKPPDPPKPKAPKATKASKADKSGEGAEEGGSMPNGNDGNGVNEENKAPGSEESHD